MLRLKGTTEQNKYLKISNETIKDKDSLKAFTGEKIGNM